MPFIIYTVCYININLAVSLVVDNTMFKNQVLPTYISVPVNSMEELFGLIETYNFCPFIHHSPIDETNTYPTTMEKFDDDQHMLSFRIDPDETIGLDKTSAMSSCNDSESSSQSSSSQYLNDEDKEHFDLSEWMIHDHVARKIRPPKLYEFLHLLLNNPRYVSYASWLNKNEGLFKIHRPSEVACLWKRIRARKTTGSIDYDTFSRCIRYYYKTGAMIKTRIRHTYCFARV